MRTVPHDMTQHSTYRWTSLRAGPLALDGGSMFGLVPKAVWSKLSPPDESNRIRLTHNCLLLRKVDDPAAPPVLIEVGSGDKFDAKMRAIFGLSEYSITDALREAGVDPGSLRDVIVSHLHFDHAGGLARLARNGETADWSTGDLAVKRTFSNARVHVQRREWDDAIANHSVMTRTYLRENLEPVREQLALLDSPPPFPVGHVPHKADAPATPLEQRIREVLPGINAFVVPGHTWGQQAILFTDDRGRTMVFTPDVLPTVHHIGAAYNMAYDVEPYVSMNSRRWFLDEAAKRDWLLVLDHEPDHPLQRVRADGKGWYKLVREE